MKFITPLTIVALATSSAMPFIYASEASAAQSEGAAIIEIKAQADAMLFA